MRPEQFAHDTVERPQRRFDDVECEECGRTLLGNETVAHHWFRHIPGPLCGKCWDRLERHQHRDRW